MNDQEKAAAFVDEHGLDGDASVWLHDVQAELGEVAAEVLDATDYGDADLTVDEELREEMADLYFSVLALADALDIDLSEQLDEALDKYRERVDETGGPGSTGQNTSS